MFTRVTPIIPVADLSHAAEWFPRSLGFEARWIGDTMVHLHRDAVNIRLVRKADDMDMDDPRRQQSIYIDVEDVDALYAVHHDALRDGVNHCAPFDRPYGMRELHVIYESLLMFFGHPIPEAPAP